MLAGKRLVSAMVLGLFGLVGLAMAAFAAELPTAPGQSSETKGRTSMVLGVSWQPAFCEGKAKRPECGALDEDHDAARQFSLNGLWLLRKSYCGVDDALKQQDKKKKWLDMPELALDPEVKLELARAMPGVASGLDRHEWIKHGTCSGEIASRYYQRSLKLLAALNSSAVQQLFESRIGSSVTQADVQRAFDTAFGAGAGEKIKMKCRKDGSRNLVSGLTIGLGSLDDGEDDLRLYIAAAGKTKFGCAEGVVDAVGDQ